MRLPPFRRVAIAGLCAAILGVAAAVGADAWVASHASAFCRAELDAVPEAPVALVLGCAERLADGRTNLYFQRRIDAAAELFRAGRVRALLVSGDNGSIDYDEPTAMKTALIAAGVPAECIHCDHAGFRTLDSVVRADLVFGQRRFVVVSQRFHAERAVYLARRRGIEAFGYCARDVEGAAGLRTRVREVVARAAAVLDAEVLGTGPRFLGPRVDVLVSGTPARRSSNEDDEPDAGR